MAAVICIGWFLVANIEWFKANAFPHGEGYNAYYHIHVSHLFLSVLKRSVALFSGFFLMFIGSSILLFTSQQQTKVGIENAGVKANLETAAPGMVAMLFGMLLIMQTTASKDTFPDYVEENPSTPAEMKPIEQTKLIRPPLPSR